MTRDMSVLLSSPPVTFLTKMLLIMGFNWKLDANGKVYLVCKHIILFSGETAVNVHMIIYKLQALLVVLVFAALTIKPA